MMKELRTKDPKMLVAGNHTAMVQSILDFDYAAGKVEPSVTGIISSNKKTQRLFFGGEERLIPVYSDIHEAANASASADFLFNITSAGSVLSMVSSFFTSYPNALGAHIFAENVAERDALSLIENYGAQKYIAGPSGVGLCIPTLLKLGAIGGISGPNVTKLAHERGGVAVVCSSGGMVNELMYQILKCGSGISFAVAYGGDRFPITSPLQWIFEAEEDPLTREIVFFGELGGKDEYEICTALKEKKITKPVYVYIAGHYTSEDEAIQFGHAKALANEVSETAAAKMDALKEAGAIVGTTFEEYMSYFSTFTKELETNEHRRATEHQARRSAYFASPAVHVTSEALSFTEAILKRILMRSKISQELASFTDTIFQELIDHGPNVSGAVTTMITTRAGRDLSSALAAGILTIGDRFGGALNEAARVWHGAIQNSVEPNSVVIEYSKKRLPIPGIGHLKYSTYKPDPRIAALKEQCVNHLSHTPYLSFAEQVARITEAKKQNLILNVDGAIAAMYLDYLVEKEHFTQEEIQELIDIEFFNSLFIIARSVGFVGHHLDQRRIDEGLFRLKDDDVYFF